MLCGFCFSTSLTSARDASQAGTAPKITPVTTAQPNANASVVGSSTTRTPCKSANCREAMSRVHQNESGIAIAPPTMDSTRLSVSDCLSSRPLPPPMAPRIANSRARAAVRASCRLARFTHEINSTRKVRPNANADMRRITGFTMLSSATRTPPRRSRFVFSARICLSMAFIAASACASVTPGLRRANSRRKLLPRSCRCCTVAANGRHISIFPQKSGYSKSLGITPTTAVLPPLSRIERPTIVGSPLKRRCQNPYERTATSSAPV